MEGGREWVREGVVEEGCSINSVGVLHLHSAKYTTVDGRPGLAVGWLL